MRLKAFVNATSAERCTPEYSWTGSTDLTVQQTDSRQAEIGQLEVTPRIDKQIVRFDVTNSR